jgi:putative membrane protein
VKVSDGVATACCQAFGKSALLSLSLAPKTTEDFPRELGVFIHQEAEKLGLSCCVVVNAHNSIDETPNMQDFIEPLKVVATQSLKKAVAMKKLPFKVGSATVVPKDFSLRDGMGLGGITVMIVEVGKQKIAYVVIDGNNMVAGLREKILAMLRSMGLDDGEVFTTDTHMVNALVLTDRGYCPIGEAIDHDKLVNYVKQATKNAVSKLKSARAGCNSLTITKIKVIGEKKLESLCLLVDKAIRRAKKIVGPIFIGSGVLLILFLLFL